MKTGQQIFFVLTAYLLLLEVNPIYIRNVSRCTKCPPGWGVAAPCIGTEDTICERCKEGKFYSSSFSPVDSCQLCSQCGVGLYESRRCSPKSDTVCNECVAYIDHKNLSITEDFIRQCSYLFMKK